MSSLLKYSLKTNIVKSILSDIVSNISRYYYTFGRAQAWVGSDTPHTPDDTYEYEVETKNDILLAKYVDANDAAIVIPRVDWSAGFVYDMYDEYTNGEIGSWEVVSSNIVTITLSNHGYTSGATVELEFTAVEGVNATNGYKVITVTDPDTFTVVNSSSITGSGSVAVGLRKAYSGVKTLYQAKFYVLTSEFNVYKCLFNNNNLPSTVIPSGTSDVSIKTADGYIWKYMYTIPLALRNKFLTTAFMPVVTALTEQFYSSGAITNYNITSKGLGYPQTRYKVVSVEVINGGSGYTSAPTLVFPAPDVGGTTAVATVSVSSGVVTGVNVTTQGSGYIYPPTPVLTSPNGSSGFLYRINYGRSTTGGYTDVKVSGDGYDSQNPYSLKRITITDPGEFTIAYSGTGLMLFPSPTNGRTAAVNLTTKVKTATAKSGTWAASGSTAVTLTINSHGYITGDSVALTFTATSGTNATSGTRTITVVSPNTFTITNPSSITGSGTVSCTLQTVRYELDSATTTIANSGYGYKTPLIFKFNSGTWIATTSTTVTSTINNHGYVTGDSLTLAFTNSSTLNVTSVTTTITVVDNNTFTATTSLTGSGTVRASLERANVNASLLTTTSSTVLKPISLNLRSDLQKNAASIISIINGSGEIEALRILEGGEGYTFANIEVNYVIEDLPDGTQVIASTDPSSPLYRPFTKANVISSFTAGDITSKQSNTELFAVDGSIEVIKVDAGGSGYSLDRSIQIVGDGTGATAELVVEGGVIQSVIVTNIGSGYTTASVVFGSGGGSGAILRPIISPKGGHGKDAISELYAKTIAFSSRISNDKNNGILTSNAYRQFSLIKNPRAFGSDSLFKGSYGYTCLVAEYKYSIMTGTWAATGTSTVTININSHGLTTGDSLQLFFYLTNGSGTNATSGTRTITVTSPNTFTITNPSSITGSGTVTTNKSQQNDIAYSNFLVGDLVTALDGTEDKEFRVIGKTIDSVDSSTNKYSVLLQPLDSYVPSQLASFRKVSGGTTYTFTANNFVSPSLDKFSGEMLYIDNRGAVTPSSDQAITLLTLISF